MCLRPCADGAKVVQEQVMRMCRYNMVVDVNEMGVKHTCRFLLGQISESSIHAAVLEAPLEYLLCQNGPSKASWWYVSFWWD